MSATFRWEDGRYVSTGPKPSDNFSFTAHEFDGRDILMQSVGKTTNYALARKLAQGVYLYFLVEEDDADEATRKKLCIAIDQYSCRVETHEALLALARATAARPREDGHLAIIVAEDQNEDKK